MDPKSQISQSLTVVASSLTRVDVKIAVLLKTAQEAKLTLQQLHNELQGLRKSLRSLSACLKNTSFTNSTLTSVKTEKETLFQYVTTILFSSISTLKGVEAYVKHLSKSSKGGKIGFLHTKKSRSRDASPQVEVEPTDLGEKVRFLALGLEIGTEIINIQTITHITKPHLRDVRLHIQALADATAHLQTSRDSLVATSKIQDTASTAPDYSDICLRATDFTIAVTKQADVEMTRRHSGFEPMSPLVEVLSNNTLLPSVTVASVLNLET